jgi:hypothetical protein
MEWVCASLASAHEYAHTHGNCGAREQDRSSSSWVTPLHTDTQTRASSTQRQGYICALNTGLCLAILGPSSSYWARVWQTRWSSLALASMLPPNHTA